MSSSQIEKSFFISSALIFSLCLLLRFTNIDFFSEQDIFFGIAAALGFGVLNFRFWARYVAGFLNFKGSRGNLIWLMAFKSSAILLVVLLLRGRGAETLLVFVVVLTIYLLLGICIYGLFFFKKERQADFLDK